MQKRARLVKPLLADKAQITLENSGFGHRLSAGIGLAGLCLLGATGILPGWMGQAELAAMPSQASILWVLLAGLGLVLLAKRLAWVQVWREPDFLTRFGLIALVGLGGFLILSQRLIRIDGRLFAWIEDDALVSMQYARHWVEGLGLVWTLGQRVEGFSNPLWTLIMGGACAVLPRDLAPLLMLGLNLALGVLCFLAGGRLARALGASPLTAALAMLGLGLSYEIIFAIASGMETVAVAALSAVALADVAQARVRAQSIPMRAFILGGLLGLLRFDGLIPGIVILALAWQGLSPKARIKAITWTLAPAAAWMLFRLGYYGDWLPNTVRLKSGAWPGRWQAGFLYVWRTAYHAKIAWALGLLAWVYKPLRPWALALVVLLGYGVFTGGDFYPGTRYLAAAWPLLWALPAAGLSRWGRAGRAELLMAIAVIFSYHAFWAFPGLLHGGWAESRDRIKVAMDLDRRVQTGERVAAAWAGAFFYYSSVQGVDLLGKCDRVVAQTPPDPAVPLSAHNKLNLEHSLGELRPEWVLLIPPGLPWPEAWLHANYDKKVWLSPLFREHCRIATGEIAGPWELCHCHWGLEGKHANL